MRRWIRQFKASRDFVPSRDGVRVPELGRWHQLGEIKDEMIPGID